MSHKRRRERKLGLEGKLAGAGFADLAHRANKQAFNR
jgi:hypothetical protein